MRGCVHTPPTLVAVALLSGLLATGAALTGITFVGSPQPEVVVSLRGEAVELYGEGLYRHDTFFVAANNRSSDIVTLGLAVPLLGVTLARSRAGSLRARLLLVGVLGYLLYVASSYALGGVAFNRLFLLYVAWLSASLFAFVLAVLSLPSSTLPPALTPDIPRKGPGVFMLASAAVTALVWLAEPLAASVGGTSPRLLDTYTTLFTHAFDLAVIVPAAASSGVLILGGRAGGYLLAFSLLVLEALLLPLIAIATAFQLDYGIRFTPGEILGPIAGFAIIAALSVWVMAAVLRRLAPEPATAPGT